MKEIKVLLVTPTLFNNKKNWERKLKKTKNLAQLSKIQLDFSIYYNLSDKLLLSDRYLESIINTGFTGAVNCTLLANSQKDFDWFLILNDDAFLKSKFFKKLYPLLVKKKYDVISCGVEDASGKPESFGLSYSTTGLAFPINNPSQINNEFFCGTVFLISKACVQRHLKSNGYLFHPLYFAYAEDLELSLRMKINGEKIYIHPEALVIHEGSKTAKRGSEFQLYHGYRNLFLTIFFHWNIQKIVSRLPLLIYGQLYCLSITVKNRRYRVYARILWYFIKNFQALLSERAEYHSKPLLHS